MSGEFSLDEVSKHNKPGDAWLIIDGWVYDVSTFAGAHPGGEKTIMNLAGKDASKEFNALHDAQRVLANVAAEFKIGRLATTSRDNAVASSSSSLSSSSDAERAAAEQAWRAKAGSIGDTLPYLNRETGLLEAERKKSSFAVEVMTNILDGGAERTAKRRWILAPLEKLALFGKHELQREELLEAHFRDFIAIHKPFIENGYMPKREEVAWMSGHSTNSGPLMPHMSLALTTILGQASEEQIGWWLWRALTFQMVISYSQTELAHGSNVRGLQTTAVYDKATGEFVLNTPTLESIKWWNSGVGLAATHALVFAQLSIDGVQYGIHVFMVQIRDEQHRLLDGLEVGDLGAKLGDHGIDTGYMCLKDVRVPREHMLSKRQEVLRDGTYVKTAQVESDKGGAGANKLHYLTMMTARAGMISIASSKLAIAALIATRYSCMREQGFKKSASGQQQEHQIIDYQVQLYRLLKQISTSYAIKFAGRWISHKLEALDITATVLTDQLLAEIAELHISSAGLKALSTILAAEGIEDCRKCCGGHGFLLSSGVAALAADYVWQTTAEGDHVVMFLQAARALVKQHQDAAAVAAELRAVVANGVARNFAATADDWFDLAKLEELFYAQKLNALSLALAVGRTTTSSSSTSDEDSAASELMMIPLIRAHTSWFLLSKFKNVVDEDPIVAQHPACRRVLHLVITFWACSQVFDASSVQWAAILTDRQIATLAQAIQTLLVQLRPDALALVESFDIPDCVHQSSLARSDGRVYEALYQHAKESRLNKQPIDSWYRHLQPNLDLDYLRARSIEARL